MSMVTKATWDLPGGPWDKLFAGVWNKFNVAVYENAKKTLLTTIFPKSGEIGWIMVRVDKILVVPKDIDSRPMHPFVLEQPNGSNNHTASVYLYDEPGGKGRVKFDLYYIPRKPAELGLAIPWAQ